MDMLSNLEDNDKDKDTLLKYMPWSKELPEECNAYKIKISSLVNKN